MYCFHLVSVPVYCYTRTQGCHECPFIFLLIVSFLPAWKVRQFTKQEVNAIYKTRSLVYFLPSSSLYWHTKSRTENNQQYSIFISNFNLLPALSRANLSLLLTLHSALKGRHKISFRAEGQFVRSMCRHDSENCGRQTAVPLCDNTSRRCEWIIDSNSSNCCIAIQLNAFFYTARGKRCTHI